MIAKEQFGPHALTLLRIFAGAAFFVRGCTKILGMFGGYGPEGGTAEFLSRFWFAGILELVLGFLILIGLFTRIAAFLASGEMAVAYLWIHVGGVGSLWWWENQGELAMLFAFIWLLFAAVGAGPFSLDALRRGRSRAAAAGA